MRVGAEVPGLLGIRIEEGSSCESCEPVSDGRQYTSFSSNFSVSLICNPQQILSFDSYLL